MRELSLFSGAGGGLLGTKLLGWNCVGYVEIDPYCQRVLAARIRDGLLDEAPIFGDVREFLESGAAEQYRGVADVVTAGFPCQPFSVAGKRRGADDERNMWPATAAVLRVVRPRFAFLENVPGLLSSGYFGTVLGDLAEMGFDARWGVLGADDAGAPHRRKRLWIVAADAGQLGRRGRRKDAGWEAGSEPAGLRLRHETVADSIGERQLQPGGSEPDERRRAGDGGSWWRSDPAEDPESGVGRVASGIPARVDRLRALGNSQVPAVVRLAWRLLAGT
jgi:DNA (cytosine-5)-methyltransferase 1